MTLTTVAAATFWLCVAGVLYEYVGYPALIWLLSRAFGHDPELPHANAEPPPFVSILVCALNEESVIAERIANALALDYPADRFEFVVASDGSSDQTNSIARSFADARVRLIEFASPRGKAIRLNEVVPTLKGDVVVLSDANTFFASDVLQRMVRWLSRPEIGVAVGRLVLTDPATGTNVDGFYWRYETFLKTCEARLGALLGANGAIYGFRRAQFVPLPADTLVDDFVLPLQIKLKSGCGIVYDIDSVANEEAPAHLGSEVGRRSRIGAGAFASLRVLWPLLLPTHGWTAFAFASHKVLRWICPLLMLGAFVSNLFLLEQPFYQLLFAAQVLFYGAAAAGALVPGSSAPMKVLRMATLFTSVNFALAAGFWRWAGGTRGATWKRTERQATGAVASAAAIDAGAKK